MSEHSLDYPVAAPDGVEPVIFRAQLIQSMAMRYMQAVPDLTNEEANDSAMASWDTEWPSDPHPRTMEDAFQVVDDDLSYWGEE